MIFRLSRQFERIVSRLSLKADVQADMKIAVRHTIEEASELTGIGKWTMGILHRYAAKAGAGGKQESLSHWIHSADLARL